jgi:hypothetical protein
MVEKTQIIDLISPHWFKDVSKSSIWIIGYRMMGVSLKDFLQPKPILDLGDVRVIFNYGALSYMDTSEVIEFGTDHVRNINQEKFVSKTTNIGGWTIFITPYMRDGVQRTEKETKESISAAEGLLSALNSPNIVYEKVFENIVELSPINTKASTSAFMLLNQPPTLDSAVCQVLCKFLEPGCFCDADGIVSLWNLRLRMTA